MQLSTLLTIDSWSVESQMGSRMWEAECGKPECGLAAQIKIDFGFGLTAHCSSHSLTSAPALIQQIDSGKSHVAPFTFV